MSTLDGVFIGFISDFLLAAREAVEDGVHPPASWSTGLS